MRILSIVGTAALLLVVASGCTSVPPAAPVLSAELGSRIQETRAAHRALVRMYMDDKRAEVDRFLMEEWVPVFARDLFQKQPVVRAWDEVVRSNDPKMRLDFLVGLGPRLQAAINRKRTELIRPLDEMERSILRRLDDNYDQMLALNATLTGLLASASRGGETRQEILKMLNAQQKLPSYLDKVDEVVNLIVAGRDTFDQNHKRIEDIVDSVKEFPQGAKKEENHGD